MFFCPNCRNAFAIWETACPGCGSSSASAKEASSMFQPLAELFKKEDFRPLKGAEAKEISLYCAGCKRLLAEAEVYGFRRGLVKVIRCWCGFEDEPIAKHSEESSLGKPYPQLGTTKTSISQRTKAIDAAAKVLPGGRKKLTACLLAVCLGWGGAHKFYLGETIAGFIYLFWFWTAIPFIISLYEAITLLGMSSITFNMTYNLDLILASVEAADKELALTANVFSLESTSKDEDVLPEEVRKEV